MYRRYIVTDLSPRYSCIPRRSRRPRPRLATATLNVRRAKSGSGCLSLCFSLSICYLNFENYGHKFVLLPKSRRAIIKCNSMRSRFSAVPVSLCCVAVSPSLWFSDSLFLFLLRHLAKSRSRRRRRRLPCDLVCVCSTWVMPCTKSVSTNLNMSTSLA